MMTMRRGRTVTQRVTTWTCTCERCGHTWEAIGPKPPAACAKCKNRGWNIPRGTVKPGPKPKKPATKRKRR